MSRPNIVPITRTSKFFSGRDFDLEIRMSREFVEGDGHFKVVLYRVDRDLTPSDIYNEARKGEVVYKTPVEISVMPLIAEPENKTFNGNGSLRDLQDGTLSFSVYNAHLQELDVEISYGDYIGYPVTETEVRFFSVVNDGIKNYDNKHTIYGYKGAYRTIVCAPVDYSEFDSQ